MDNYISHPFKASRFYRHPSTLDTDLRVLSILGWGSNEERGPFICLLVRHWNRHMKTYQGPPEAVWVRLIDFNKWQEVLNE